MLSRLKLPLFLAFFISIFSLYLAPFSFAFDVPDIGKVASSLGEIDKILNQAEKSNYLEEFCQKRTGNQVNLETWYSGKCRSEDGKTVYDSFSGEGVGFSSIIFLDLAEKIKGKKAADASISNMIQNVFQIGNEFINGLKNNGGQGFNDKEIKSLQNARAYILNSQSNTPLGAVTKITTALLTTPPASSLDYIAYVSQNLKSHKVVKDALAAAPSSAGYGFQGLSPLLPIWKMFRNIAYVFFALFFIVYGFMMMFRVNINAKTVITVQLALPKLIATLLMITFSYAIVGFLFDLMYVFMFFCFSVLETSKIIRADNFLVQSASGQWSGILSFVVNGLMSWVASTVGVLNLILGGPSFLTGIVTAGIILIPGGGAILLIIMIILTIAILISYVKLIWNLIQTFIGIVVSLVTAPLILLGNAFPGSNSFNTWIMGMIANISVFPISILLLTFSYVLMVQPIVNIVGPAGVEPLGWVFGVYSLDAGGSILSLPLIQPILGNIPGVGMHADALLALIGVGLLLMANKYVSIVRDALKVPPFKYGSAITDPLKEARGRFGDWSKDNYKLPAPIMNNPITGPAATAATTALSNTYQEGAGGFQSGIAAGYQVPGGKR